MIHTILFDIVTKPSLKVKTWGDTSLNAERTLPDEGLMYFVQFGNVFDRSIDLITYSVRY